MSEQPTKVKAAEPLLCKMGCGFFGNNATGDCCSKCWASIKPKDESPRKTAEQNEAAEKQLEKSEEKIAESSDAKSQNSNTPSSPGAANKKKDTATNSAESPEKPKKKKKKASYKSMMAGMLEGNGKTRDVEKEKEKLKEVTGGGHFQKIDKI